MVCLQGFISILVKDFLFFWCSFHIFVSKLFILRKLCLYFIALIIINEKHWFLEKQFRNHFASFTAEIKPMDFCTVMYQIVLTRCFVSIVGQENGKTSWPVSPVLLPPLPLFPHIY